MILFFVIILGVAPSLLLFLDYYINSDDNGHYNGEVDYEDEDNY